MAAETGFMIDGALYEVPSLDTFTMDEAQVLYDYSGLTIEDFAALEDEDENEQVDRLKNPGFMRALMHIAYQRGNEKLAPAKVKALIGAANLLSSYEHLAVGEDDALPPESTTEPEQQSLRSSVEQNEPSGDGSTKSSDGQVVPLEPITTLGSGTSSTATHPAASAR